MKKEPAGIGYVRKSCYYDRKGVTRFSDFVQISDLATKSRGSYFCYKTSRHRGVCKNCYFCYHSPGNKGNRKIHHTPGVARWN